MNTGLRLVAAGPNEHDLVRGGGGDVTAYEELGAGRGVRLRALHECDAAQIGRGASWWWIVRGTRPPGSREVGRVGRHGGEKSAEESSADMACSPWGGGVV